jgi:hypothetical protein
MAKVKIPVTCLTDWKAVHAERRKQKNQSLKLLKSPDLIVSNIPQIAVALSHPL